MNECEVEGCSRPRRAEGLDCRQCYRREWTAAKRAADGFSSRRDERLRSAYGIGYWDFQRMLSLQGGRCAICLRSEPVGNGWHVDHCHETGEVRGVLCAKCNPGLGMFDDKIPLLMAAIDYLENARDRVLFTKG